jgi:hypothetical protein
MRLVTRANDSTLMIGSRPDTVKGEMVFENAPRPIHEILGIASTWPGAEDLDDEDL